jgi:DNA invertase Pin-like site-specific DNA recombinase
MAEPVPAAIYCRISHARDGSTLGVDRQEPPTRLLCERLGWKVERVFVDNDLSAYHNKRRPDFEELLAWAQDGHIRAIAAWDADRLTRQPRENEDLIDLAERYRIQLATVTGEYDLATPSGRLHFRIKGAIARHESEHRAERIRLKQQELAHAGEVGGGGTRPFGYLDDRVTPHTFGFCLLGSREVVEGGEAGLVREAAERVLLGEALHAVLMDWTKRGIPTISRKPWRTAVLRRLLLSARIAGLRQHQGATIGRATWPAIIDEATHERLKVLLTDPVRQLNGGKLARSYLLTGLIHCGVCGQKLVARPREDKQRRYVCATGVNFNGCGKILRLAEPVENLVREQVFAALDSRDWDTALQAAVRVAEEGEAEERELLAKLKADDAALEAAEHAHFIERDLDGKPVLSRPRFLRIKQELEASMEETRRKLARVIGDQALASFPRGGEELRAAWEAGGLSWRRAFLTTYIERVVLLPCVRGLNRFDPTKVSVIWRV